MQSMVTFFLSSSPGALPFPTDLYHSLTYTMAGNVSSSLSKLKQSKKWMDFPGFPVHGSCSINVGCISVIMFSSLQTIPE